VPLRLILVRHGLSSYNLERRIQGRDDLSSLSEPGAEQARAVARSLAELPIDAAFSSPLRRAADTARLILAGQSQAPPLRLSDGLLEIDLSPWSGLLRQELSRHDPEGERRWRLAPHTLELQRPDGRSYLPLQELMQQAAQFCRQLQEQHREALSGSARQTVLLVAHNGILRCLVLQLLGLPASGFRRLRLDNASTQCRSAAAAGAPRRNRLEP
jgi:probable phosphoglycerate mutase